MAIKWKNKLTFIIWLLLLTFGASSLFLFIEQGARFIGQDYFETSELDYEIEKYLDYLSIFILNETTKEEALAKITVTSAEIDEHRYRYGNLTEQIASIHEQYQSRIDEAQAAGQQELANLYINERDAKIADITKNFADDEYVKEKIIKEKKARITAFFREKEKLKKEYSHYQDAFVYYFVDTETNKLYSNLPNANNNNLSELLSKIEVVYKKYFGMNNEMLFDLSYRGDHISWESQEITVQSPSGEYTTEYYGIPEEVTAKGTFKGAIAITKKAIEQNPMWANYHSYKKMQQIFYVITITGFIALIICILFYKKINVEQVLKMDKWQHYYRRIPIDIRLFMFFLFVIATLLLLSVSYDFFYYYNQSIFSIIDDLVIFIGSSALFLLITYLQGKLFLQTFKDWQNLKEDFQKSALVICYRWIQEAFIYKHIGIQVFLLLVIVFLFGVGFVASFFDGEILIVYLLACLFIALPILIIVLRRVGYLNKLILHVEQLANGNLQSQFPVKGKSILANFAKNINLLREGLSVSQKQQIKSERLKTELITNVSHDLRTPLTSIITYTELLKNPDISEDEKKSYIEIIDRKSKRLKVLIDDLFEASKMASGNMELVKEKVDLVSLLQQALAEHDEKIADSSFEFRINHPTPPVYAIVDGQKLWRVFDNLISNILKYTLENTRVYISMTADDYQATITFKNITKYELGDNVDELIERFKRGDTSRHTEGSGLGLAISKSIIDLHDGTFEIDVDGDLFKVTITLPISKN